MACPCCCVDCACDTCVKFSITELGDIRDSPPPEPTVGEYSFPREPTTCLEKTPCFDFEYVPDPVQGQLGEGCGADPWDWICRADDQSASVLTQSFGGEPCARLRCDAEGGYFLDVCVFNTCFAALDPAGAGRLTRKTYAVTLGEDGCPVSIGEELSSDVTDWERNFLTGQWDPWQREEELDGDINGTPLCNQECWGEEPFDFQFCDLVYGVCDCDFP